MWPSLSKALYDSRDPLAFLYDAIFSVAQQRFRIFFAFTESSIACVLCFRSVLSSSAASTYFLLKNVLKPPVHLLWSERLFFARGPCSTLPSRLFSFVSLPGAFASSLPILCASVPSLPRSSMSLSQFPFQCQQVATASVFCPSHCQIRSTQPCPSTWPRCHPSPTFLCKCNLQYQPTQTSMRRDVICDPYSLTNVLIF